MMAAARWLLALAALAFAGACGDRSLFADQQESAPRPFTRPDAASITDAARDIELNDSAGLEDALPDAGGDACTATPGPGPLAHLCVPPTANECDGQSDSNRFLPNGGQGNGFDDDCDGEVDERCSCGPDFQVDATRTCWLVPSSQVELGARAPVGWCREHSRGLMKCVRGSGDAARLLWSGQCEGAAQPFADDVCAPGDFDCDGKEANSRARNCACMP